MENEKSQDRLNILNKIDEYEKKRLFDQDVEDDPPGRELLPEEVDYLNRKLKSKFASKCAFFVARRFMNKAIKNNQLIIKEIIGIENIDNLKSGAVLTCNHFSPFDSFAMQIAYESSKKRRTKKMYRVIKEGNYTSFPGFYGFLMRHCNTLPLSSNYKTMHKFITSVDAALKKGNLVLIYPEQSMWWNYRKPKPLKPGAFKFSYKNKVPVVPCFITMEDSEYIGGDGFPIQEYTIHIAKPIYPDMSKDIQSAIEELSVKNFEIWKQIYEDAYMKPLTYL